MSNITKIVQSSDLTAQNKIAYDPVDNAGGGHFIVDHNTLVELVYTYLIDMYGTGFAIKQEDLEVIQAAMMEQSVYVDQSIIAEAIARYL